ncbi:16S rRNA (guanine(527)-N(7))-methyltransferase RsmG [Proteiniclasticum sp. SCR006]|uniref:Ribosomal RNA small subunit methyltransferase G n=1 Tax=Proteiniclasticum aestuarii TaxID=2817862 RepID=A0A939HCU9_9CLOT|nr:16S rRNA (guanine(527)-N(7))-methyltransferase RsmG [Proteiniclasticum aestuarii]MBO1265642.1 16S rRNA (guanine(527)-N(7))-methyltransferase RsmG [Proteiniclasticum aestuarii]
MYFDIMKKSADQLNLTFSRDQYEQFMQYKLLLKQWNEKLNLTAITEDDEIISKHFIDSIQAFQSEELNHAESLIDVGTGAGFPGLPIKIMKPELKITLLDSLNKRLNFLRAVSEEMNLENVEFVHSRAEDGARKSEYRDSYDVAVSRAVANLTLLTELCLPYVKVGGHFIALKGPAVEQEIEDAEYAVKVLGGKIIRIQKVKVEGTDLNHNLVVIRKMKPTPKGYPRSSAAIKKSLISEK